ncbi:MAG TPA: malto-oligosyltrehalose trehalohydrolase [Terriglobales bacterium]|nr:malto-oligosyltrehalose trehalohydrolase [Terriglobales bacterium]
MHTAALQTLLYGATPREEQTEFRVWAPTAKRVDVQLESGALFHMYPEQEGNFQASAPVRAGERYFYVLDGGRPLPDPVSRLLPEGVHGPTQVVDPAGFRWSDAGWRGLDMPDYVIYELHVGTFTPEGTFDAAIGKLDYLKALGITVVEVMPVAATPGCRNWGYDGVAPYAVQACYGGPDGLKRFVDAAHQRGMAVILDVVYNHLGPEGNYFRLFGPYFNAKHTTPWGDALNFDGPGCGPVRRFFINNALYWIHEYHMDGLRLDAIQNIQDDSQRHIIDEINAEVQQVAHELGRNVCVIAETDENKAHITRAKSAGGWDLCGQWSDDFHHSVHTLLTGENEGYYGDFGVKEHLVRALNEGFVYQGQPFKFWKNQPRGTRPEGVPMPAHVICIQNHDQVGNRATGERLNHLVPRGACKLAAALLLLAPHTPLLFMGEEFAASSPFQFFTDFGDPDLQKAVSKGRREEFKDFSTFTGGEFPDPQDPATFDRSKLRWEEVTQQATKDGNPTAANDVLEWYKALLDLRHRIVMRSERTCKAELRDGSIVVQVPANEPKLRVIAKFPDAANSAQPDDLGAWSTALSSAEDGYSVTVLVNQAAT